MDISKYQCVIDIFNVINIIRVLKIVDYFLDHPA